MSLSEQHRNNTSDDLFKPELLILRSDNTSPEDRDRDWQKKVSEIEEITRKIIRKYGGSRKGLNIIETEFEERAISHIYEKIRQYDTDRASFRPWCYRVLDNLYKDIWRKYKRYMKERGDGDITWDDEPSDRLKDEPDHIKEHLELVHEHVGLLGAGVAKAFEAYGEMGDTAQRYAQIFILACGIGLYNKCIKSGFSCTHSAQIVDCFLDPLSRWSFPIKPGWPTAEKVVQALMQKHHQWVNSATDETCKLRQVDYWLVREVLGDHLDDPGQVPSYPTLAQWKKRACVRWLGDITDNVSSDVSSALQRILNTDDKT
ncbi:MAG: hypothetical protein KatS3mg114_0225 [Planctomycetaceae bacterium]|nr:MAG: hypothetical protein KatS3mg114_0225 [Planctomycetaceae bacterium]